MTHSDRDHDKGNQERPTTRNGAGRVASVAGGALAALVLYLCVPAVLVLIARVPVPRPFTMHSALTARGLVDLLALAVWVAWATEVFKLVRAVIDRLHHPERVAATGLRDRLAIKIAALVLVLAPVVVGRTTASQATPVPPAPVTVVAPTPTPPAPAPVPPAPAPAMETSVTVVAGDSLSAIALRLYGSESEWTAIWVANQGRPMVDGRVFTNPNLIYLGWQLVLPLPVAVTVAEPAPVPSPSVAAAPSPTTTPPAPGAVVPAAATLAVLAPHAPVVATRSAGHPTIPVRLPSGSVVGGSFAAGVLAAVALGRLRRRHAYRYQPPEPGLDLTPEPPHPTLRHLAAATGAQEEHAEGAGSAGVPALADDDPDHRERPDLIEVGTLDGEPVHLALSELAGVAISGPGAEAVVAAWVGALMVRAGPIAAEVIVTRAALDRLFGTTLGTRIEMPGLRMVEGPDHVLRALEATVVARTRSLAEADVVDVVSYRRANPWEPVPMVLAVLDQIPDADAGRWAATLAAGPRLGFAAVVLDPHATTPVRLDLGADRVVVSAVPDDLADRLLGAQLFGLAPEETADVIAALAEAEQRPDSTEGSGDGWVNGPVGEPAKGGPAPVCSPEPEGGGEDGDAHAIDTEPWPDTVAVPRVEPPVTVSLLGPYEIRVGGQLVTTGLRTPAKELLAWFLLRPDGATVEAAVDALWPDTEPAQVHKQFWLGAANLRRLGATSEPETKVLTQAGTVYRVDADAVDCDLWQFQAALSTAARADEDRSARDALRRTVDCYRGDLLAGTDYPWVEPVRQDLRRRALDAHLRLANLEARLGSPDGAEAALQRAVALDRYSEEPYRRLMVLQGERARPDLVAETWQLLERRLVEIDVDVEPATLRLYRSLTATGREPTDRGPGVRLQS